MPNIEIHGLHSVEAKDLAEKIFTLTKDMPKNIYGDHVITLYGTEVINRHSEPQPYLRILSSKTEHFDRLEEPLKALGIDLEFVEMVKFIPAAK